jgi:c-di-GMP-binding flagellar brake protein YcgR
MTFTRRMIMSDSERRKFKRINSDLEVKIKNKNKNIIDQGQSVNMSACGILIQYNKSLEIGALINVKLLKPNTKEFFDSNAEVVRVELNPDNKTYDIGLQFLNLTKDAENKLDEYLSANEPEISSDDDENCYYVEIELPDEYKDYRKKS